MKEIRKNVPAMLVLLLISGFAQGAFAQADPPERIARLNFIDGTGSDGSTAGLCPGTRRLGGWRRS